ncbi:hypothetical protein RP20_CCG026816 [Aedes albopictus]|nr:hypothetical protein RP20_CCG026816 [Aedes albopictus]
MHGIQHLFRQHALEKQSSTESWHSAYAGGGSTQGSLSSQGNFAFSRPPNERSHSVDEAGSTYDSSGALCLLNASADSRNGTNPQLDFGAMRSPASQEYHIPETSTPRSKKSPDGRASLDFGRSGLKMLSKRNITGRRSSLESAGSPPMYNNAGFFPHDLDDIYEYKTDHQYFTHTGGYDEPDRSALSSDYHRNMLFQRNHAFHSLDEYANAANHTLGFNRYQYDRYLGHRNRFDNSSFARKLTSSISQSSIDSSSDLSLSSSSKEKHHHHRNHHKSHHHHSITEMLKSLGKKAHIWPGRTRHQSINESHEIDLSKLNQNEQVEFRGRSRSLGTERTRRILDDCESTYNIYNKILKEAAHMRRASAELAERRRASLGASRALRPDGTLDPYHAAILFRDSRGNVLCSLVVVVLQQHVEDNHTSSGVGVL